MKYQKEIIQNMIPEHRLQFSVKILIIKKFTKLFPIGCVQNSSKKILKKLLITSVNLGLKNYLLFQKKGVSLYMLQ